jgi:hypothetical protein
MSSQQLRLCSGAAVVEEAGIDYEAASYGVPETKLWATPPSDYWVAPASSTIMAPSPALCYLWHKARGRVWRVDAISQVRAWWDMGANVVFPRDLVRLQWWAVFRDANILPGQGDGLARWA